MTKEESTKTLNFMTRGAGVLVLWRGLKLRSETEYIEIWPSKVLQKIVISLLLGKGFLW